MESANASSSRAAAADPFELVVRDLSVRLPTGRSDSVHAVRDVSLQIRSGERVGIVGESGSGKSVTGRAIAGLLPSSPRVAVEGSIAFNGVEYVGNRHADWSNVRRRLVSMVFQDPLSSLNPTMRIGKQVAEARDGGLSREQVRHFMSLAGLSDPEKLVRKFPFELSGGMRQRVSIAIALSKEPALIIADEPTTALDVTVQARVLDTLKRSVTEMGASLLMISHDLAVIAEMCDRVYVMYRGEIVEHGDTRKVFREPHAEYTQRLVSSVHNVTDIQNERLSS